MVEASRQSGRAASEQEAAAQIMMEAASAAHDGDKEEETRLWMDGAFDMMHYGHMNAFRQARALGTHLIAGVNSDASITACKGRPLTDDAERLATVRGCRWVDAVVEHVPYVMHDAYLHAIISEHRLDAIVHGDDPCIVDGKDVYEAAQVTTAFLCFVWCDTCYIVCWCVCSAWASTAPSRARKASPPRTSSAAFWTTSTPCPPTPTPTPNLPRLRKGGNLLGRTSWSRGASSASSPPTSAPRAPPSASSTSPVRPPHLLISTRSTH